MNQNFRRAKAIEAKNKKRILEVNPHVDEGSGIYFLTRTDDDGIRYAYIGQAKHLLTRLAQHLSGYQHIDLSIKNHGLYAADNITGWKIGFLHYQEDKLDEMEQKYIRQYAQAGYQLRNKTAGGQGEGKKQIDEYRPVKGYHDGLKQGYINASREIAHLFDLHLTVATKKDPPTVHQKNALEKFEAFLRAYRQEEEDE